MYSYEELVLLNDEVIIEAAKSKDSFFKLANALLDAQRYYLIESRKASNRGDSNLFWIPNEYVKTFGERYLILSRVYSQQADELYSKLKKLKVYSKDYKSYWSDYVIADVDMSSDIASRIKIIIAHKLSVDENEVTPEASFKIDFEADEFDFLELIIEFEKEFNICIQDDQLESIDTVWAAIKFIENNIGKEE